VKPHISWPPGGYLSIPIASLECRRRSMILDLPAALDARGPLKSWLGLKSYRLGSCVCGRSSFWRWRHNWITSLTMAPKTMGSELLPVNCGTRRDGLMIELQAARRCRHLARRETAASPRGAALLARSASAEIEPNEQKTIGIVQIWSLWQPPAKHVDLLPQNQIFRLNPCTRPKERS
jgi:hypothetical protein